MGKDRMALEHLFSADAKNLKSLVERHGSVSSISSEDWEFKFGPEPVLAGYGLLDVDMVYYWHRTWRFEAQRPLIHNGRKGRKWNR